MDKYSEYEETVRVSRMTFNDTVTKYNREVRSFPGSVIASMLGFPVREYLADRPEKSDLPEDLFKK
jgi:LemA protein